MAVDPAAEPLLTGQVTSLPGLLGVIAALPEMNAQSVAVPELEREWGPRYQLHGADVPGARSQCHVPSHDRATQTRA